MSFFLIIFFCIIIFEFISSSFLSLAEEYSTVGLTPQFVYPFTFGGILGCFWFLTVANEVGVNICVQIFVVIMLPVFLGVESWVIW